MVLPAWARSAIGEAATTTSYQVLQAKLTRRDKNWLRESPRVQGRLSDWGYADPGGDANFVAVTGCLREGGDGARCMGVD